MSITVFLAVLMAALLHATWNALVKGSSDKLLNMSAVVLGHLPIALVCIALSPIPDAASWPFLFVGIALHVGYQFALLLSYRVGDLTQVYPIARGVAPLLVAGISVFVLGVSLTALELLAVALIGAGIISLSLVRQSDGLHNHKAAAFALLTGGFIASYSLVDGYGARAAGEASVGTALGYYGWLTIGNGIVFASIVAIKRPGVLTAIPQKAKRIFVVGGAASFAAYALVMWSFTMAPIALVTALRETSIIFALAIGIFFLNERISVAKVLSTLATIVGAVMLRFSRQ
ncbi:MAG: EamA family transporter [Burkholderiaceae bacterium]